MSPILLILQLALRFETNKIRSIPEQWKAGDNSAGELSLLWKATDGTGQKGFVGDERGFGRGEMRHESDGACDAWHHGEGADPKSKHVTARSGKMQSEFSGMQE